MEKANGNTSKLIIMVLATLLTFVVGWQASSYSSAQAIKDITDTEIQRTVGPQLATMNQKLNDIEQELGQIAAFSVKSR